MRLQLDILIKLAEIKGRSVHLTEAMSAIEKVVAFEADLANVNFFFLLIESLKLMRDNLL